MPTEKLSSEDLNLSITNALTEAFGTNVQISQLGGSWLDVTIPAEGINAVVTVRNLTGAARSNPGELRFQVSIPASQQSSVFESLSFGIPVLAIGIDPDSGIFTAEDPIRFNKQLPTQIANDSNLSKGYTHVDVIANAQTSGVGIHRYVTDQEQISVSFRPQHLGWYISNYASIHEIGTVGSHKYQEYLVSWAEHWIGVTEPTQPELPGIEGQPSPKRRYGKYGGGGESDEHRDLKVYVAKRPDLLALNGSAVAHVETGYAAFRTADHCDVVFEGGGPPATVVEVELGGSDNLITGVHQAVKYRSLAAARLGGIALGQDSPVRAAVIAYESNYSAVLIAGEQFKVEIYEGAPNSTAFKRLV